jgi:hypothetical protein
MSEMQGWALSTPSSALKCFHGAEVAVEGSVRRKHWAPVWAQLVPGTARSETIFFSGSIRVTVLENIDISDSEVWKTYETIWICAQRYPHNISLLPGSIGPWRCSEALNMSHEALRGTTGQTVGLSSTDSGAVMTGTLVSSFPNLSPM